MNFFVCYLWMRDLLIFVLRQKLECEDYLVVLLVVDNPSSVISSFFSFPFFEKSKFLSLLNSQKHRNGDPNLSDLLLVNIFC